MKSLGLIGYPLGHSFSKQYFNEKFEQESISEFSYHNFPLASISEFPELLQTQPELIGLNVTIPHKQAVIPYLDELDEHAARIGAVNTIKIVGNKTIGYNTDWLGFRDSIIQVLKGKTPSHALILGSGGASKAICYALEQFGTSYNIVSRQPSEHTTAYHALSKSTLKRANLIVNCTPLGMAPDIESAPPIDYTQLQPGQLLYDLVYNPEVTQFMQNGMNRGTDGVNGYDMLVRQAEHAWKIWNA